LDDAITAVVAHWLDLVTRDPLPQTLRVALDPSLNTEDLDRPGGADVRPLPPRPGSLRGPVDE
jgi:hypothetical protein